MEEYKAHYVIQFIMMTLLFPEPFINIIIMEIMLLQVSHQLLTFFFIYF